ncbi:hypothetical protein [Spirosoma luteum]|uniref:hypothetical protein n=1 Tax=Spirosoma luteum TaxID=431553 RepID=UPI00036E5F61|nr:hypothetical protein [Spirosoma luteum]
MPGLIARWQPTELTQLLLVFRLGELTKKPGALTGRVVIYTLTKPMRLRFKRVALCEENGFDPIFTG